MKKTFILISLIFLGAIIFIPLPCRQTGILAQNNSFKLEINFFYSKTCPHCIAEQTFLDKIEKKYPEVKVNRYLINDSSSQELLKDLLEKHNAEKYFGAVPMNFVGEDFMPGFDNDEGIGKQIEDSIQRQLENPKPNPVPVTKNKNAFPAWAGLILIIIVALILLVATKKKKRNIKEV